MCSRTAHSGFISSGPRRMECRGPVAQFHATGDDARSEEQPSHPLLLRWKKGEVRERPNRAVSKTAVPFRGPWVRIPPSPPYLARQKHSDHSPAGSGAPVYQRAMKFHCREKVSLPRQRPCRGWDSNRGIAGDVSPAWGDTRGLAPSVGARTETVSATSNSHPSERRSLKPRGGRLG